MPILRYTLEIEGESIVESDTFERAKDYHEFIQRVIVDPLARNRATLKEPPISLTKVEVTNPYVHQHTWERTHISRFALKSGYRCPHCGITGYRRFNVVSNQETQVGITRDEQYQKEKFALCKEPLKQMPKKIFG